VSISSNQNFRDSDDCIDQSYKTETFSIANLIRGRQPKRQKTEDLRPIAFVRFNTSLGPDHGVTYRESKGTNWHGFTALITSVLTMATGDGCYCNRRANSLAIRLNQDGVSR